MLLNASAGQSLRASDAEKQNFSVCNYCCRDFPRSFRKGFQQRVEGAGVHPLSGARQLLELTPRH